MRYHYVKRKPPVKVYTNDSYSRFSVDVKNPAFVDSSQQQKAISGSSSSDSF